MAPFLTLFRKEEFSVIILGLDGAGKTVCESTCCIVHQMLKFSSLRLCLNASRRHTMTSPAFHLIRSPLPSARIVRTVCLGCILHVSSRPYSGEDQSSVNHPSVCRSWWSTRHSFYMAQILCGLPCRTLRHRCARPRTSGRRLGSVWCVARMSHC
jgi:hypothetical protein